MPGICFAISRKMKINTVQQQPIQNQAQPEPAELYIHTSRPILLPDYVRVPTLIYEAFCCPF